MIGVVRRPNTQEKLEILSADAQYDLACACGSSEDERRRRGRDGRWIYPVTLPNGGKSTLFKTLISNVCTNDCKYCPLREQKDARRCSLGAEETAEVFMDYIRRREVFGMFLSSGVCGSADAAMERLNNTAKIVRKKYGYKGYIHLKIIPGASDAAVEEAVSLASAVSVNIETPGEARLAKLSSKKRYVQDIIRPMKLVSRLTGAGARYSRVKQTTQFIVGAADEADAEIVRYMAGLYERLKMHRVYFSAYQKGPGEEDIGVERTIKSGAEDTFRREHRLYQVDFLMRKYGFKESDIIFDEQGGLSLETDPKQLWAERHPEFFPVDVNRAEKGVLLRVPGFGPITVRRILERRRTGRVRGIEQLGRMGVRLQRASEYVVF